MGPHPDAASALGVHDLVGNGWEWTSSVFAPLPGFRGDAVVSRVLGRLLRWPALRDERRLTGDGAGAGPPELPQLVPPAVSLCLRDIPMRGASVTGRADPSVPAVAAEFALEVSAYLQRSPRQLPSKYFYDELGSALFEAICRLPWYRVDARRVRAARPQRSRDAGSVAAARSASSSWVRQRREAVGARRELGLPTPPAQLIDVSQAALDMATYRLRADGFGFVSTYKATYLEGLTQARRGPPRGLRACRPLPGLQHRQFQSSGRPRAAGRHPAAAAPGRCAAARGGSREAGAGAAAGV